MATCAQQYVFCDCVHSRFTTSNGIFKFYRKNHVQAFPGPPTSGLIARWGKRSNEAARLEPTRGPRSLQQRRLLLCNEASIATAAVVALWSL